jgi:hypothetical protein
LPSGCGSCPVPAGGYENSFDRAELFFEIRIGTAVYNISNPGSSSGFSSGVICGNHISNDPGDNAVKGSFTFNMNIDDTFYLDSNEPIYINLQFVQTSRYNNREVAPQYSTAAHALAVIDVTTSDCCLSVTKTTTFDAPPGNTIKFFGLYEVGQRLIDKLTDNGAPFKSVLLSRPGTFPLPNAVPGCGSMTWITLGGYIRGARLDTTVGPPATGCSELAPLYTQKFQLSFKDYMEALNALFCIGMGPGLFGEVEVEEVRHFYQNITALTLNLGDKKERKFVRKFDPSRVYSVFRSGYDKWESDLGSARAEFNAERLWNLKTPYIKNELNRICKWIAAGQVFETARRNHFSVVGPTSFKHDSDIFLMQLDTLLPVKPERGVFSPSPPMILPAEQLNWRLRPSSMLYRWLPWLAQPIFYAPSLLNWLYPGKVLGFAGAGGGDVVSSTLPVSCNRPVEPDVSEFPLPPGTPPFLRPEVISFETVLTMNEFLIMRAFPRYLITLTFDNEPPIEGWIKQLAFNPTSHLAQIELIPKL